jgi:hypothetical protein
MVANRYFDDAVAANMGGEGNNMLFTTSAGANIVWIGEVSRTDWTTKLNQARSLQAKVILVLYNQFFGSGGVLLDTGTLS